MRAYAIGWTGVVAILAAGSGAAVFATSGWQIVAVTGACAVVLGVLVGVTWAEETGRRMVLRCAAWSLIGALLVVGLPVLLGVWSLAVLAAAVVTSPPLVAWASGSLHEWRVGTRSLPPVAEPGGRAAARPDDPPADATAEPIVLDVTVLGDRELERRWHVTSVRLRHPGTTPDAAMALVAERVLLLDEIERRNPEHFAAIVGRVIGLSDEREGGSGG